VRLFIVSASREGEARSELFASRHIYHIAVTHKDVVTALRGMRRRRLGSHVDYSREGYFPTAVQCMTLRRRHEPTSAG